MKRNGWPANIQKQIDAQVPRLPSRNKMGAVRSSDGTRMYASKLERDRAMELQWLQRVGYLFDLEYQPKIQLGDLAYRADFKYKKDSETIYEDAKGHMTPRFRMVVKLWIKYMKDPLYISQRCRDGEIRVVKILCIDKAGPVCYTA